MKLQNALTQFENTLFAVRAPIINKLEAGLDEEKIVKMLRPLDISNSAIIGLYEWHNGVKKSIENSSIHGELVLFSSFRMRSLEEAIRFHVTENEPIWGISKRYFSLFDDGGPGLLIEKNNNNSKIYYYSKYSLKQLMPMYENLEKAFETASACYRKGVFTIGNNGILDIDYALQVKITKELNPNCNFWKSRYFE